MKIEREWRDQVHVTTVTEFGLFDRLRILLGQKLTITTITNTTNVVGRVESHTKTSVGRFFGRRHVPDAMEMSDPDSGFR